MSRVIKGYTVELVNNINIETIISCIEKIIGLRDNKRFKIQTIYVDSE